MAWALELFLLNGLLILLDASVGYFAAPYLVRLQDETTIDASSAIRIMRRMLAGVVALYMFLNCLAYGQERLVLQLMVTALAVSDMVVLVYFRHKFSKHDKRDTA